MFCFAWLPQISFKVCVIQSRRNGACSGGGFLNFFALVGLNWALRDFLLLMCTHKSHSRENCTCALRDNTCTKIQIVYSTNLQVEDFLQIFFPRPYSSVHTVKQTVGKQMKAANGISSSQNVWSGVNLALITEKIRQTWMSFLIFA